MRGLILIFSLLFLSACAAVGHLDELLVLNEYSHEMETHHKMINQTRANYLKLKSDYEEQHLPLGLSAETIRSHYGEPIFIKALPEGGQYWVYREGLWYKDKDKIYLDFNANNELAKVTFVRG